MIVWFVVALAIQAQADAPPVRAYFDRDTVTIGDPLSVTFVVEGLAGHDVQFPLLPDTGDVTSLTRPVLGSDERSGSRWATYELAVWRTGDVDLPAATIIAEADGHALEIPIPPLTLHVRSVLPADADPDTLAYRPVASVLGASWSRAEKLAGAGLALALLAVLTLLVHRARARSQIITPPPRLTPEERALAALEGLAASGLADSAEHKAFYSQLTLILREFVHESNSAWGLDLTSFELLAATRADELELHRVEGLRQLLNEADLVKFARRNTPRGRAVQALAATRRWIVDFEPPALKTPLIQETIAEYASEDGEGETIEAAEAADGEETADSREVELLDSVFDAGADEDTENGAGT